MSVYWLYLLFFISGFPAILYQIVWQRALFTIFGVNIESVTVVVSAFMLGLGLGSLLGGRVSTTRIQRLRAFGGIELGIAAFGLISLPLFRAVAEHTAGAPPLQTFLISFVLIVFPTILMGATLPILTAELVARSGNVGRSVGMLYFANTLGSAAACFAAALVTMPLLGMSGSVYLAAALNVAVGLSALLLFRPSNTVSETHASPDAQSLSFSAGLAVAAITGFIALGYEIVWYRVYSFVSGGSPRCFAFVLGAFLAGIAFGSLLARRLCLNAANPQRLLNSIATLIATATVLSFLQVTLLSYAIMHWAYEWTLPLLALAAGTMGAVFPLLTHVAVPADTRSGAALGRLYLANIAGSATGSYIMGFVLMDLLPLQGILLFLTALGMATAVAVLLLGRAPGWKQQLAATAMAGLALGAISPQLFHHFYERMQFKNEYSADDPLVDIVETRSGVVTTDSEGTISGGGARDGILSTDLLESDSTIRPFSLSYFHPAPRRVLLIGVAGGAWSQIVANHPQLEHAVAVEINPGYLEVISRYPEVSPLLRNPKLEIVIDDGRRWMMRNRQQKFDAILMDSIQHWRAQATNLLSVEMLTLAKSMLTSGGILFYNTTYSADVQRTSYEVFPHIHRFGPFIAASETPLQLDEARWRDILWKYRLDGKPVLDPNNPAARSRVEELAGYFHKEDNNGKIHFSVESQASIQRRTANARVITDDNMASEWRRR